MESNILVGTLIGITLASTAYVWNSEEYNSSQKVLLTIFIIFPPLQWLSIILILIYNRTLKTKSIQEVTTTNLTNAIDNLKELKDKGILNEEEYNLKSEKIQSEKIENQILNSTEYLQLKNLYDLKVLSKEEFESKVEKIRDILKEKFEQNKQQIEQEQSGSNELMKIIFLIVVSILILLIISITINQ